MGFFCYLLTICALWCYIGDAEYAYAISHVLYSFTMNGPGIFIIVILNHHTGYFFNDNALLQFVYAV